MSTLLLEAPLADLPRRFLEIVDEVRRPDFLATHNANPLFHRFMADYYVVPFAAAVIYLTVIFGVQRALSSPTTPPLNLRLVSTAWNALLCAFSTYGMIVTIPYLVEWIRRDGFVATLCRRGDESYMRGPVGVVSMAFIWSKIPELFDTVLLVAQKKPLIFLHWYHHLTVMLYCWSAVADLVGYGMYFVVMNYTVHAVMYGYYAGMTASSWTRAVVSPCGKLITTMQLLQMIGGMLVIISTYVFIVRDASMAATCHVTTRNMAWCGVMYLTYFVLFGKLFYDYYLSPGGKKNRQLKLDRITKRD